MCFKKCFVLVIFIDLNFITLKILIISFLLLKYQQIKSFLFTIV